VVGDPVKEALRSWRVKSPFEGARRGNPRAIALTWATFSGGAPRGRPELEIAAAAASVAERAAVVAPAGTPSVSGDTLTVTPLAEAAAPAAGRPQGENRLHFPRSHTTVFDSAEGEVRNGRAPSRTSTVLRLPFTNATICALQVQ
jgi:hypothetical protein